MTNDDEIEDKEFQQKINEAQRVVDNEVRQILRENPMAKKDQKLASKLLLEACKNDRKLLEAMTLAAAAGMVGEELKRELN